MGQVRLLRQPLPVLFAPSLFIGAMLGAAYGAGVHDLLPGSAGVAGAYALVGMGAVFAGASRAPITAVVIFFELTGEYSIILPLMLAIVLATATSRLLTRDTIYTLKGCTSCRGRARPTAQHVGAVMEPLPSPLPASTMLADAADPLSLSGHGALPVLDDAGDYVGIVTAQAVAEALAEQPEGAPAVVGQLAEPPAHVTADQPLAQALHVLPPQRAPVYPSWNRRAASRSDGSATRARCAPYTLPPDYIFGHFDPSALHCAKLERRTSTDRPLQGGQAWTQNTPVASTARFSASTADTAGTARTTST